MHSARRQFHTQAHNAQTQDHVRGASKQSTGQSDSGSKQAYKLISKKLISYSTHHKKASHHAEAHTPASTAAAPGENRTNRGTGQQAKLNKQLVHHLGYRRQMAPAQPNPSYAETHHVLTTGADQESSQASLHKPNQLT
jgi:hypothetical protein